MGRYPGIYEQVPGITWSKEIKMQKIKMQKTEIGNVLLYYQEGVNLEEPAAGSVEKQLQEIVLLQAEDCYHSEITARKNWTVMYELAESRANLIEWIQFKEHAKVLEIGAGCGTLTSVLIKKGASVTCQDENVCYCKINALRHRQEQMLTIYAVPFDQCETHLYDDYDVVVMTAVPLLEDKAEKLLQSVRKHLKSDGLLVLAAKNKFGLKYWAGNKEMYTHTYFAGLESNGIRLYSRESLKKLLHRVGFERQEFYYPYPDERFALDIYSDRYLPKKGDLNYNIVNYEDDRILLFDEQKVFDSLIEEGQFPFFANAFLCLATGAGSCYKEQEVIYTRYASDRSSAYALCTQITEQNVWKRAVYPQGAAHVEHILHACERLQRQYAHTELQFNRCAARKDAQGHVYAEFELLQAQALQEQISQAICAGEMHKVFEILDKMIRMIRSEGTDGTKIIPFEMTEAFRKVFGELRKEEVLRHTVCSEISDIDLILANILVGEDGTWHVIDYEWTFFFPIPQNFIIYRTLFFLNHENPQRDELSMERLLERANIPLEEAEVYAEMETAFQQYVTGGLVPYREMVNLLERRFFNVVELKADYDRIAAQNKLLKGQGIWKAVRKIKKKLTGN